MNKMAIFWMLLLCTALHAQTVNVVLEDKTIVVDGVGRTVVAFPTYDAKWSSIHWKDDSGYAALRSGDKLPITTNVVQPFIDAFVAEQPKTEIVNIGPGTVSGEIQPSTPEQQRLQLYSARMLLIAMEAEYADDPKNADIQADRDAQAKRVESLRAKLTP